MAKYRNPGKPKHSVDDSYFSAIDCERKAYWLGFITADGCIYEQKCKHATTYRLVVGLSSKDRCILEEMARDFNCSYPVRDRIHIRNGKEYYSSILQINSKPFCEHLMRHGVMPRKSLNENIPELGILTNHFLRGFFDGDGSVKKQKGKTVGAVFTGGQKFMEWVKRELTVAGIDWSNKCLVKTQKSEAWQLGLYSKKNLSTLYKYLYTNSSLSLARKRLPIEETHNEVV